MVGVSEWRRVRRHAQALRRFLLPVAFMLGFATEAGAQDATAKIDASVPHVRGTVQLSAEIYRPVGPGPFPAVVLLHGCGGWQPAPRLGLRLHANFLRDRGFVVLNLESFSPRGLAGGVVCESFEHLADARAYRTHDAFDALRHLRTLDYVDPDNIFLVGQSNGGSVAMIAAARGAARAHNGGGPGFRGAIALYPWCGALGGADIDLEIPLLVLAGARDDWTPPEQCQQFRSRGAPVSVTVFPDAAHSFDVGLPMHRYLGKLVGYDDVATRGSRDAMLSFLRAEAGETELAASTPASDARVIAARMPAAAPRLRRSSAGRNRD